MPSTRFSTHLDTSHDGLPYPFKEAGVVADSLTGIHNATVKRLFVVNMGCTQKAFFDAPTGKNPEDSKVASVEAMQWILLYLSIHHNRCY
jgi:hypothetical protein